MVGQGGDQLVLEGLGERYEQPISLDGTVRFKGLRLNISFANLIPDATGSAVTCLKISTRIRERRHQAAPSELRGVESWERYLRVRPSSEPSQLRFLDSNKSELPVCDGCSEVRVPAGTTIRVVVRTTNELGHYIELPYPATTQVQVDARKLKGAELDAFVQSGILPDQKAPTREADGARAVSVRIWTPASSGTKEVSASLRVIPDPGPPHKWVFVKPGAPYTALSSIKVAVGQQLDSILAVALHDEHGNVVRTPDVAATTRRIEVSESRNQSSTEIRGTASLTSSLAFHRCHGGAVGLLDTCGTKLLTLNLSPLANEGPAAAVAAKAATFLMEGVCLRGLVGTYQLQISSSEEGFTSVDSTIARASVEVELVAGDVFGVKLASDARYALSQQLDSRALLEGRIVLEAHDVSGNVLKSDQLHSVTLKEIKVAPEEPAKLDRLLEIKFEEAAWRGDALHIGRLWLMAPRHHDIVKQRHRLTFIVNIRKNARGPTIAHATHATIDIKFGSAAPTRFVCGLKLEKALPTNLHAGASLGESIGPIQLTFLDELSESMPELAELADLNPLSFWIQSTTSSSPQLPMEDGLKLEQAGDYIINARYTEKRPRVQDKLKHLPDELTFCKEVHRFHVAAGPPKRLEIVSRGRPLRNLVCDNTTKQVIFEEATFRLLDAFENRVSHAGSKLRLYTGDASGAASPEIAFVKLPLEQPFDAQGEARLVDCRVMVPSDPQLSYDMPDCEFWLHTEITFFDNEEHEIQRPKMKVEFTNMLRLKEEERKRKEEERERQRERQQHQHDMKQLKTKLKGLEAEHARMHKDVSKIKSDLRTLFLKHGRGADELWGVQEFSFRTRELLSQMHTTHFAPQLWFNNHQAQTIADVRHQSSNLKSEVLGTVVELFQVVESPRYDARNLTAVLSDYFGQGTW